MRLIVFLSLSSYAIWGQTLDTPSEILNKELPKWIRLQFDHRFRMEGYTGLRFREDNPDRWLLSRLRANVTLSPTSWLSFTFQAQDARVFFKSNPAGQIPLTNRTDLHQAFAEVGKAGKSPIAIRVGRQEMSYGDERIVGAANWGSTGRVFDAVKVILHRGPLQLDLAASSVVALQIRGFSDHQQANNLHVAYLRWTNPVPDSSLEPYFLWRVGRGNGDALAGIIHQDRRVAGVRFVGKTAAKWDYNLEALLQTGNLTDATGNQTIRTFASHNNVGKTFTKAKYQPRPFGEYNFATGDRDPGDHRSETFDQIFPTAHAKYGLADQVGWQNIHNMSAGVDLRPLKPLTLRFVAHNWYLAQPRDGLYIAGGGLIFRDASGRSGRHVGEEFDVIAQYTWKTGYVGVGYGHLFPGAYLRSVSPGVGLNYQYLNVGYKF